MKFYNKLHLILIGCLIVNSSLAENLVDLYNFAKNNDQTMQAALKTHKAQLEALPQARALLLPTISAKSGAIKYNSSANTTRYNTWQYGLNIAQPIFQMANWNKISQAKDEIKKAFATLADAEQSLLLRISEQYFEILKAQDNLHFIKIEQQAFAKHLEQTKQRYKVGLTPITDVHEAQAVHDSAFAKVIAAENALANTKEKLTEIIGRNILKLNTLKKNINLPSPNPTNIDKWVQVATEKNWQLQVARYDLAIARKKIQLNRAEYYPTLQLEANINRTKNIPAMSINKTTDRTVGIAFNMPIFNGGSTLSKTRQAGYNYEKTTKDLELKYRTTESSTKQAYRGVLTQLSQIKAFKQAVISNTSALKATKAAFEVGNRTVVDVLDAQSSLINAEKDHSKARYDYIIQSLQLKYLTGALSFEDLQEINKWLAE